MEKRKILQITLENMKRNWPDGNEGWIVVNMEAVTGTKQDEKW
jgi:hypothetical protein